MKKSLVSTLLWGAMATVAMSTGANAEQITVMNFANYMPEDILTRFKAETGIDVELVTTSTNEESMGKIVAGNGTGFDVVFVSSPFAEALQKLNLISEIDHSKLPNLSNLYDVATKLQYDPGNVYSIPYSWGTTGLCYRSDLMSFAPDSWQDLLNPKDEIKGKITMISTDRWLLAAGQLANGYSVNDVDAAHLEEVKADLINAKKTLLAYDNNTMFSKLVSGEAVMAHAWDGWCNFAIAENPNVKFVVPKEGSDFYIDVMVIPSATEHKEAAQKFINFVLQPENQKWVVDTLTFKVPNRVSMETVSQDHIKKFPNLALTPDELSKFETFRDLGADLPRVSSVVTEITASK